MGKLILEVPGIMDMKLKTQDISEAIRTLVQLKRANSKRTKHNNIIKGIQKFKGIAKYRDMERPEDEWYDQ